MEARRPYRLSEALATGLVGYAAVAVVIAAIDLALGRSILHTPAMLGRPFVEDPGAAGNIHVGAVLAYNGLHLVAFLVIGLSVAAIARVVELRPALRFGVYFVIVATLLGAELTFAVLDPGGEALTWWSTLCATVAATFAMGMFINQRHPHLRAQVMGQR